jgi:hypothetical protein
VYVIYNIPACNNNSNTKSRGFKKIEEKKHRYNMEKTKKREKKRQLIFATKSRSHDLLWLTCLGFCWSQETINFKHYQRSNEPREINDTLRLRNRFGFEWRRLVLWADQPPTLFVNAEWAFFDFDWRAQALFMGATKARLLSYDISTKRHQQKFPLLLIFKMFKIFSKMKKKYEKKIINLLMNFFRE